MEEIEYIKVLTARSWNDLQEQHRKWMNAVKSDGVEVEIIQRQFSTCAVSSSVEPHVLVIQYCYCITYK